MAGQCMNLAHLTDDQMMKLSNLINEIGVNVIAVDQNCHWSTLSADQLDRLKQVENDLGVVLLAYEPED